MPDEPQEADAFARAGITDADFATEEDFSAAPIEAAEPEPADDGRARDEHGRFVAKDKPEAVDETGAGSDAAGEQAPAPEPSPVAEPAPATPDVALNLTPAETALWASAPPELRAGVARRITELESGLTQYQQTIAPLKPLVEMAGSPQALAQAAQHYIGIEQLLARDPIAGLSQIAQNLGTDLRTIAAHVMGQPVPEPNVEIGQLRQQLQAANTELQTFRQEKAQHTQTEVEKFAAERPRFHDLTKEIAWALKTGLAADLASAYEYAERLKPAPQAAPPLATAQQQTTPQEPRTPPVNLSIDGGPGSNPGYVPPANRRQNISDRLTQFGVV